MSVTKLNHFLSLIKEKKAKTENKIFAKNATENGEKKIPAFFC
jgi:hypothetical protein